MIRIDTTKTNMTDKQAAAFMLDILELIDKENSVVSDIRFKSRTAQVREMICLKKDRERFSNALNELVEISGRLKGNARTASGDQTDKLLCITETLTALSIGMENEKNEECGDNWCSLIAGCEGK